MAPAMTKDAPRGTIHGSSSNSTVNFTVRAVPLPIEITSFLQANMSTMRRIQLDRRGARVTDDSDDTDHIASKQLTEAGGGEEKGAKEVKPEEFWAELEKVCAAAGRDWAGVADQVWAFGPKRVGPNLLIDRTNGTKKLYVLPSLLLERLCTDVARLLAAFDNDTSRLRTLLTSARSTSTSRNTTTAFSGTSTTASSLVSKSQPSRARCAPSRWSAWPSWSRALT